MIAPSALLYPETASLLTHQTGAGMLVIVDSRITALAQFAAGLQPGAQMLVVEPSQDAIAQISQFLTHHPGFQSLHLVGHGQPGQLQLGRTPLTTTSLQGRASAIQTWSAAFTTPNFDLLIYGCNVAQGGVGQALLRTFAILTGANIAASKFKIGNGAARSYWQLETHLGQPQTALALTETLQNAYPAQFVDFNVANVTELLTAITTANSNGVADTINLTATTFDLTTAFTTNPASGPFPLQAFTGPTGLPIITDSAGLTIRSSVSGTQRTIQRTGTDTFRIFAVSEGAALTLEDVIVSNGSTADTTTLFGRDGGGILNVGGTVSITNSQITNNSAIDDGGGILNVGTGNVIATMTITGSTISGNRSSFETGSSFNDGGGGIDNDGNLRNSGLGAVLTITNSTISANTSSSGSGGGLRAWDGATLTINNSNITNNTAGVASGGGGLAVGSEDGNTPILSISNTTITGNSAGGAADDASVPGGNVTETAIQAAGTFSGNTVDTADALDVIIEGPTTVTPTPTTQTFSVNDAAQGIFNLGDTTTNGRVLVTLNSSTQSQLGTLQATTSSGTTNLFSLLPDSFQPSSFSTSTSSFLLDVSSLATGSTIQFSVGGQTVSAATTQLSTGRFLLQFDLDGDGATDDLSLTLEQVATTLPIGVGTTQANGGNEVVDLTNQTAGTGNLSATFTLFREADFNNTVGLYRIDDASGAVNGLAPGSAGYAQAALNNRVSGLNLQVGDNQSTTATASLDGGALYAPFIVVDATVDSFLNGNAGDAFFLYTAANSDGQDHVVLLGSNTFAFEDLFGGGDADFNDLIFSVSIT